MLSNTADGLINMISHLITLFYHYTSYILLYQITIMKWYDLII